MAECDVVKALDGPPKKPTIFESYCPPVYASIGLNLNFVYSQDLSSKHIRRVYSIGENYSNAIRKPDWVTIICMRGSAQPHHQLNGTYAL